MSDAAVEARRFFISGKVQGVFFRDYTRREAERLGLAGYALNLDDGRVEVLAQGAPADLDALARWLADGSPASRVDQVNAEPAVEQVESGFATGWRQPG